MTSLNCCTLLKIFSLFTQIKKKKLKQQYILNKITIKIFHPGSIPTKNLSAAKNINMYFIN